MAWSGAGVFSRIYNWVNDKNAAINITASRMDGEDDGFATGLNNCLTKDGQNAATANLPMATFRHTNVGNAAARTDYASAAQIADGALLYAGAAGGTANALTANLSPAITAYVTGQVYVVILTADNTAAATININSVGVKNIKRQSSGGLISLSSGDLRNTFCAQFMYNGADMVLLSPVVNQSARITIVYTANSTWTKQSGLTRILVRVTAPGGGGGGAFAATGSVGAGGGCGGTAWKKIEASALGATETVTCPAGGAGGAAGNNDGVDGAAASFGAHISCPGGLKGGGAASGSAGTPSGNTSAPTGGDFNSPGGGGGFGIIAQNIGGLGAASHYGQGGKPGAGAGGAVGGPFGSGGGGGGANGAVARAGGDGAGGLIVVEEYY